MVLWKIDIEREQRFETDQKYFAGVEYLKLCSVESAYIPENMLYTSLYITVYGYYFSLMFIVKFDYFRVNELTTIYYIIK